MAKFTIALLAAVSFVAGWLAPPFIREARPEILRKPRFDKQDRSAPSVPPEAAFIVETVGGDRLSGAIVRLAEDGSVQLSGQTTIAGADLVEVRRSEPPPPLPHDRSHAIFTNGDRLPGRLVAIENERVRFSSDWSDPKETAWPLSSLAAIWCTPRAAAFAALPANQRSFETGRKQDVIRLSNGDTLTGTVLSLAADGPLKLDTSGSTIEVARERIDAILFNTELSRKARPRGSYRRLVLRNGARLSAAKVTAGGDSLAATMLSGQSLRVPLTELAALAVLHGPAVYLSDLKPLRYDFTPYLDLRWPVVANHSVAGNDLRVGGGTFDFGLGLHSACKLAYAVPAGASRLELRAGLDDATGRRGAVSLQIFGDGKPLMSPERLSGSGAPKDLRLPLPAGAKEITIEVGYGPGGDVQDHLDLVNARFVVPVQ